MSKRLELIFTNVEGKNVTVALDDPVEPVDAVSVSAAMDQVLTENAFTSSGGDLVAKKSARVVERNVQDIQI